MTQGRRILIVDDDPLWAELVSTILAMHGCLPIIAGTIASAFVILREQPVYVTLLDLKLPDSDTLSTLEHIRILKGFGAGRVIIITGAIPSDDFDEIAAGYGADKVLAKMVAKFQDKLMETISA